MADFGKYSQSLALVGCVALSYAALRFFFAVWDGIKTFILPGVFGVNPRKMGRWAVVTGATDGIGKAYATQLAKKGMDIVLISRTAEKLDTVASEIESQSKVATKCIAVDFTKGPEIYNNIREGLQGLEIGVLVNNVGMGYPHPENFGDLDEQLVRDLVRVNCMSVVEMTHLVLPDMVSRKRGIIVNISSGSGFQPVPMLSLYSSTKVFVDFFSRAVQAEYASKGLIIQSVLPFFVTTKLSKIRRANLFIPNPTTFVKSAMATIGVKGQTTGYLTHGLQAYAMSFIPDFLTESITLSQMKATKARALKKAQKAQ